MTGIVGKKIGMTRIFKENGECIPVTVIEAGPCSVVQIKTVDKEGYNAIQLGYMDLKEKFAKVKKDGKEVKKRTFPTKPYAGHFEKNKLNAKRYLKEFRVKDSSKYEIGQEIKVDIFNENDKIDVTGISKGRGFQGVIKRHNFAGGFKTHGSKFHRRPGSIGNHSDPAMVFKGKKMPGQMGNAKVTTLNIEVVGVDAEKNIILVKGSIPGKNNGIVAIRRTVKNRA